MAGLVHLVRHGEVENPRHVVYAALPGFDLSDLGRAQAREMTRYLRSAPITAIWSSPLQRALSTAEPLAAALGLPIRTDDDLTEWHLADDWAGIVWEDLPTVRPGQLEAYLETPLDMPFSAESLTELAERMRTAVTRMAKAVDGDVVVVSHQDPVQAVRLALTGRDPASQHRDKPGHATVITLRPGNPWEELAVWHAPSATPWPPPGEDAPSTEEQPEQLGIGLEGEIG